MTKICKDCKHYQSGSHDPKFGMAICKSPMIREIDVISGKAVLMRATGCASQRVYSAHSVKDCGPGARFYEPSILKRIKDKIGGAL